VLFLAQTVMADKLWSDEGIRAALGCVLLARAQEDPELGAKLAGAWERTAAKAKDLPFLLHYSAPAEDLYHVLVELGLSGGKGGLQELLRPMLDLKPQPPAPAPEPEPPAEPEEGAVGPSGLRVEDVEYSLSSDEDEGAGGEAPGVEGQADMADEYELDDGDEEGGGREEDEGAGGIPEQQGEDAPPDTGSERIAGGSAQ
jgi:hypothetical protein